MNINITQKLHGHYTILKRKAGTGEVLQELNFQNVITNDGLNSYCGGTNGSLNIAAIGTGTNAPLQTDGSLGNFSRSTNSLQANTQSTLNAPPYTTSRSLRFRFPAGSLNGNYTEVGVGKLVPAWASTTPPEVLFSRALILDGLGNPTTITVLSDEFLDIVYTLSLNPPLTDVTGSVDIGGTNYDYLIRPANVTANSLFGWEVSSGSVRGLQDPQSSTIFYTNYNGAAGTITGSPSGTAANINGTDPSASFSAPAYSNNSFITQYSVTYGLNQGNIAGGFRSTLMYYVGNSTCWQIDFGALIPKDNTKTFRIDFSLSWAR
jgi:hypothetical protein